MGRHTESYRLVVTDNVPGREGVASSFNGWAEDPESAIAAYNNAVLRQVDGTTVELIRVENTSMMSSSTAAPATVRPPQAVPARTAVGAVGPDGVQVVLTPAMARMLITAKQSGYRLPRGSHHLGTVCALIDRGAMSTVKSSDDQHRLTPMGAVLADLVDVEAYDGWALTNGAGVRTYTV